MKIALPFLSNLSRNWRILLIIIFKKKKIQNTIINYFKFDHNGARFNFSSKKSENSGKLYFQFCFLINNVSSEICFLLPSCRVKRPCGKPRCIEFDQTELLKDNVRKSSMQREQVMLYFPCSVFAELSLQLSSGAFFQWAFLFSLSNYQPIIVYFIPIHYFSQLATVFQ